MRAALTVLATALLAGCHHPDPRHRPPVELDVAYSRELACEHPEDRAERAFDLFASPVWATRRETDGVYGLAAGDLDGDGWMDLVVPSGEVAQVYWGRAASLGIGWEDGTDALPAATRSRFRAASVADIDGDGDLDVFLGSRDVDDLVLRNDGDRRFSVAFAFEGLRTMGSSWGDFDLDGDLDLAVANGADDESPVLWVNRGDGTFDPRDDLLPPHFSYGDTFNVPFVDLDQDGWPDLYRANDTVGGPGNLVAWNHRGTFVLDDGTSGLHDDICSMGVGIGDVNGDELPDLAISDCLDLVLHESNRGGPWIDHSAADDFRTDAAALREVPWGVELADLDNDADLDGYVGYGYVTDDESIMARIELDGLYVRADDGGFAESAAAWGLDVPTQSRGQVLVDLNNDGWLDVVRQNLLDRPDLFLSRCGSEDWVRIAVHQDTGNPFAIGAKVAVDDGIRRQVRWMSAGGTSEASGGPPEVHFGFGQRDEADGEVDVEVTFPDGRLGIARGVPTRRRVVLARP